MKQQNIYDNKEFFDGYQSMRNNLSANELIEIPQLFKLIGNVENLSILDLGCGTGKHDRKLIGMGARKVTGIDLSNNMINEATKKNNYSNNYVIINDKKYFLISDYNNEGKRVSHWFVDGVETYHRKMSHLVNGLIDAGFKLERMEESYATDEAIKLKPKYIEQKDHSYYIYFKCKK